MSFSSKEKHQSWHVRKGVVLKRRNRDKARDPFKLSRELLRCSDQRVQRLPVHVLSIFWFPTDETKVAFSPFLTLSPSFSLPNTGCISGNPFITETATLGENVWLHKKKNKKIRNVALSRDGNILCVNCLSSCRKWRNFLLCVNAHFSFKITFKGCRLLFFIIIAIFLLLDRRLQDDVWWPGSLFTDGRLLVPRPRPQRHQQRIPSEVSIHTLVLVFAGKDPGMYY